MDKLGMMPGMFNRALTPIRQGARELRVPLQWLVDEAKANRIPHLDAGGRILINLEVVEAALAERAGAGARDREASHAR